jgi:hypothetical protein
MELRIIGLATATSTAADRGSELTGFSVPGRWRPSILRKCPVYEKVSQTFSKWQTEQYPTHQLQVIYSAVSDSDGFRSLVTGEMGQFFLAEVLASMNCVHDLERSIRVSFFQSAQDKVHERVGFFSEPETDQGVEHERSVSDPGVSVVPVPRSSDSFGQTESRRRYDSSGRLEGEHLQGQGRTVDGFSPSTLVLALADPLLPESQGLLWSVLGLDKGETQRE